MRKIILLSCLFSSAMLWAQGWRIIPSYENQQVFRSLKNVEYLRDKSKAIYLNSLSNYNRCERTELFQIDTMGDDWMQSGEYNDFFALNKETRNLLSIAFDSPKDVLGLEKMRMRGFDFRGRTWLDTIYDISYNSAELPFFVPSGVALGDHDEILVIGGKTTVLLDNTGEIRNVKHWNLSSDITEVDFVESSGYYLLSTEKEIYKVKPFTGAVDSLVFSSPIKKWFVNHSNDEIVVHAGDSIFQFTVSGSFDLQLETDLSTEPGEKMLIESEEGVYFGAKEDSLIIFEITDTITFVMNNNIPMLSDIQMIVFDSALYTFGVSYFNTLIAVQKHMSSSTVIPKNDLALNSVVLEKTPSSDESYSLYATVKNVGGTSIDSFFIATDIYPEDNCASVSLGMWTEAVYLGVGDSLTILVGTIDKSMLRDPEYCVYVFAPNEQMDINVSNNKICTSSVVTSQDQLFIDQVIISPNPASDYLLINGLSGNETKIQIMNMYGVVVIEKSSVETTLNIDISGIERGQYILKVLDQSIHISELIVVE